MLVPAVVAEPATPVVPAVGLPPVAEPALPFTAGGGSSLHPTSANAVALAAKPTVDNHRSFMVSAG
jgi:hypothetical protein